MLQQRTLSTCSQYLFPPPAPGKHWSISCLDWLLYIDLVSVLERSLSTELPPPTAQTRPAGQSLVERPVMLGDGGLAFSCVGALLAACPLGPLGDMAGAGGIPRGQWW